MKKGFLLHWAEKIAIHSPAGRRGRQIVIEKHLSRNGFLKE
jgi:hypothetical protein